MNEFEQLLENAKKGDKEAILEIITMFRPLMFKYAMVNGSYDEDLYEEYVHTIIKCI